MHRGPGPQPCPPPLRCPIPPPPPSARVVLMAVALRYDQVTAEWPIDPSPGAGGGGGCRSPPEKKLCICNRPQITSKRGC